MKPQHIIANKTAKWNGRRVKKKIKKRKNSWEAWNWERSETSKSFPKDNQGTVRSASPVLPQTSLHTPEGNKETEVDNTIEEIKRKKEHGPSDLLVSENVPDGCMCPLCFGDHKFDIDEESETSGEETESSEDDYISQYPKKRKERRSGIIETRNRKRENRQKIKDRSGDCPSLAESWKLWTELHHLPAGKKLTERRNKAQRSKLDEQPGRNQIAIPSSRWRTGRKRGKPSSAALRKGVRSLCKAANRAESRALRNSFVEKFFTDCLTLPATIARNTLATVGTCIHKVTHLFSGPAR